MDEQIEIRSNDDFCCCNILYIKKLFVLSECLKVGLLIKDCYEEILTTLCEWVERKNLTCRTTTHEFFTQDTVLAHNADFGETTGSLVGTSTQLTWPSPILFICFQRFSTSLWSP